MNQFNFSNSLGRVDSEMGHFDANFCAEFPSRNVQANESDSRFLLA